MSKKSIDEPPVRQYKYLPSPMALPIDPYPKNSKIRSIGKEDFLVFIGMGLTVAALTNGLRHFVKGDSHKQQLMMRSRVGFQALSVLCLVGAYYYRELKKKKK